MARSPRTAVAHLLRRAGWGATPEELTTYLAYGLSGTLQRLLNYEQVPDNVDSLIGKEGYAPVTTPFTPNTNIAHARQRWLFRMLYSKRPLQEKMALFWANHFATGYTKVAGLIGTVDGTRLMAAVASQDPSGQQGQVETFRNLALGNFFDLLLAVATDPAMLYWLDGRSNLKAKPQENFARELMELFTLGVDFVTEENVKAAARVFTGWNLNRVNVGTNEAPVFSYSFLYVPTQHDTAAKPFSFPIYADGRPNPNVIPVRDAAEGYLDGYDLLLALAAHPATARRLATKLYAFFVTDATPPPADFIEYLAGVYTNSFFDMRAVVGALLSSPKFYNESLLYSRYSWPVEHIVQPLKQLGPNALNLSTTLDRMTAMNQSLYDPPSVEGYKAGETWHSSVSMLARMNYGQNLAAGRRATLVQQLKSSGLQFFPEEIVDWMLLRLGPPLPVDDYVYNMLVEYLYADTGTPWIGSDAQLNAKIPGLVHLILGSGEYQFV